MTKSWRKNPPHRKIAQSFRIDEDLLVATRALADHRRSSVVVIVRDALRLYLKHNTLPVPGGRKKKNGAS